MSACTELSLHYHSPSLPAIYSVSQSSDAKVISELLSGAEKESVLLTQAGQILLDNPDLATLMGYRAHYSEFEESGPVTSVEQALRRLYQKRWEDMLTRCEFNLLMPPKRHQAFKAQLKTNDVPPFTAEFVYPTIEQWLSEQDRYFAERVDEIFHALSDSHITNSPSGFGGKLIFKLESSEGANVLDQLRLVLACLIGRATRLEAARMHFGTKEMLHYLEREKKFGEWIALDSGLLSLKIFKVGTVHVSIDSEMAAHLNDILSMIYPLSIPAKFRTANPISRAKYVASEHATLPLSALQAMIEACKNAHSFDRQSDVYPIFEAHLTDRRASKQHFYATIKSNSPLDEKALQYICTSLGAKFIKGMNMLNGEPLLTALFDYSPSKLSGVLSAIGAVPDLNAFQFYPTKGSLSARVAAQVEAHHTEALTYLEPSAGVADLLDAMPFISKRNVTAVELSPLMAKVLHYKGYSVLQGDFITHSREMYQASRRFDRIVMNPPFCNNQAYDHTMAAYHLLKTDGVLFAVLPASLYHSFDNVGCGIVKSEIFADAFEGTSVQVFVIELHK